MQGSPVPKQYLPLAGRCVLEWSVAPLLARADCVDVIVVLAADDARWSQTTLARDPRVTVATGGADRAESVRNGLHALSGRVRPDEWVLVHDAARPCLSEQDLNALLDALCDDPVGGLLAVPVVDTLKLAGPDGRVARTVERTGLWRAATPQLFRFDVLSRGLTLAAQRGVAVTDESQAVELLGLRPRLVAGSAENIKVTVAEDLARAERILAARRQSAGAQDGTA